MPEGRARKRGRGSYGFTILELLTAIVIIGILAGFAAVMVGKVRIKARMTAVTADLEAMARGLTQFKDDFGFYPPSRVEVWTKYLDRAPPPPPITPPDNFRGNYIDSDSNGIADVVVPTPDPSSPPARYEENGLEILLVFLSTTRKNGPYFSPGEAFNEDSDVIPGRIFGSDFYDADANDTLLPEVHDAFGSPYVYISSESYVSGLTNSVDVDGDGDSDVDGMPEGGRTLRPAMRDPRTGDFLRKKSYQLYSLGPNGIDNLGYGGDAARDGEDNDGNGIKDDEDDISVIH
jgi:prepilin-type N-terminal cleavage/methylation domain-containing protein